MPEGHRTLQVRPPDKAMRRRARKERHTRSRSRARAGQFLPVSMALTIQRVFPVSRTRCYAEGAGA